MSQKPLAGRRVIELGTMVAAPFATHILSQLGAEVIKVEPPRGDTTRNLVRGGPSGTLIAYSHSKKSIVIDVSVPEGYEAFCKLIATADVFIHNLAPSAVHKLKITPDDLAKVNPKLIYAQVRGYAHGPQENELATNPVAEASTGVMFDHVVDGRPSRLGPSYHDQFAGTFAVIRIMATMLNPAPTAADRRIEIGLYETGLHVAARDLAGVQLKTQLLGRPEKEAGGEFSMPGYGAYKTKDERWLYLLVLTDVHWQKLTAALAMPEGNDPELAKLRDRKKQRDRVEAAVRTAIGARTYDEVATLLRESSVGFTEILSLEHVLDAEQARQPGKLRDLNFRGYKFEVPEFPGQMESEPNLPPPELGEHTVDVLKSLGYSDADCAALLEKRAVAITNPAEFAYAPVRPKS
jgi:crotonobetainyl-CoA:carnitine CoA-transferase CaiB-like acyl-CoA transferase